jgi:hypothetical protein
VPDNKTGPDWDFIQSVARHMYELHPDMAGTGKAHPLRPPWNQLSEEAKGYWCKDARLAIAAVTIAQARQEVTMP